MNMDYSELNVSIRNFEEKAYKNGWSFKKTAPVYNTLTYVLKGTITYIIESTTHVLTEGDVIFIPGGVFKEGFVLSGKPIYGYSAYFNYNLSDGTCPPLLPERFNIGHDDYLVSILKELNGVWLEKSEGHLLKARALLLLVLHELIQYTSSSGAKIHDHRIDDAVKYIINHYSEKIDVKKLAALANLSPDYFGVCFKKHTGTNVREYLNRIRINKARDLLAFGGYNVGETAYACGYSDIFYFSRMFKKATGKSPIEFIRRGDTSVF